MGSRRNQLTQKILEKKMDSKTRTILWVYIAVVAITISYFIYPVLASPLSVDTKDDCFPDYAGPCYENADCCEAADGTECSNFICRPTKDKKDDCLPDYAGPCYHNADCCESADGINHVCTNFICRPETGRPIKIDKKDDCFPDYAGPCYENADCCDSADGTECSNFICRPTKTEKDCIPDFSDCKNDDDCCNGNCKHFE